MKSFLTPPLLFFFIFLSGIAHLQAQNNTEKKGPWSLQECIDYALKNNILVKQNDLNTATTKENLIQSQVNLLPTLNASASQNYNFGRSVNPYNNQVVTTQNGSQNFYLGSSLTLFSGLKKYNTIRQNDLSYEAAQKDADKMRNDVAMNVALAYLQILFSMELLDVAENQATITRSQVERTKKLIDAGSLAKGNLYDIQAQLATEELSIVNAQNQLDLAYLNLIQLLDLPSVEGFSIVKPEIPDPKESSVAVTTTQIYGDALNNQPQIKGAELRLLGSQRALAIAKGGLSPTLTLNGSITTLYSELSKGIVGPPVYTLYPTQFVTKSGDPVMMVTTTNEYRTTPFNTQLESNLNKYLSFQLNIPIFNGFQNKSNIARAKINIDYATLSLQQSKTQLLKTIQQAHTDAVAALKKYSVSERVVIASLESYKYAEQKYNEGLLNSFDYNTSKNKLAKAKSDLLQAKYDYVFKMKILDFYQGKPITL